MEHTLLALSPLDGRYAEKTADLSLLFSEYGLQRYRLFVEIRWLQHLHPQLSAKDRAILDDFYHEFSVHDAMRIKNIEHTTAHDVKAVEYFLREKIDAHTQLHFLSPWIHFACTSEDINNLAYGLMLTTVRQQILLPLLEELCTSLHHFAHEYAGQPMLARTHGQAATPTTLGKEFANMVARLRRQLRHLVTIEIAGKINGATGNFNAHHVAMPDRDWPTFAKAFVESLGLRYQAHTTQIEPHDYIAELAHTLIRLHNILIDTCRDVWGYISLGYFRQRAVAGEIGSSTMPHKVNPIDFENAEGNFYLANNLWQCLADKLPISRWQRDLVDSTLMRNLGVAIGHGAIAYQALLKGLQKLQIDKEKINQELALHWEVLGEAIQTVMRMHGIDDAYEQLKTLTRGKHTLEAKALHEFIDQLDLPPAEKQRLKQLTPANYIGLAERLAKEI